MQNTNFNNKRNDTDPMIKEIVSCSEEQKPIRVFFTFVFAQTHLLRCSIFYILFFAGCLIIGVGLQFFNILPSPLPPFKIVPAILVGALGCMLSFSVLIFSYTWTSPWMEEGFKKISLRDRVFILFLALGMVFVFTLSEWWGVVIEAILVMVLFVLTLYIFNQVEIS